MKTFGWIVAVIGTMVLSTILNGYVFSVLWGWFIVKTFALPALNIPAAIGVSLVVSYLTAHLSNDDNNKSATEQLFRGIAWAITKPLFALIVGWIVVKFI